MIFFFQKPRHPSTQKWLKKPVKHVKSYNIARDRDYKIQNHFIHDIKTKGLDTIGGNVFLFKVIRF